MGFAARGGLENAEYAQGDEFAPGEKHIANTWQGESPRENRAEDGYERTSPVTAFSHEGKAPKTCCIPSNPRGGR